MKGDLHTLSFDKAQNVRVETYMEIHLEETDGSKTDQQIREMCGKLVANPVIENFSFEPEAMGG